MPILSLCVPLFRCATKLSPHQLSIALAEIRETLRLLKRNDEDNMAATNDLSEDTRKEIDNIYLAIAELSVKSVPVGKRREPIGYKK